MSIDALKRRLSAIEQQNSAGSRYGILAKMREARRRVEASEPAAPSAPLPAYVHGEPALLTKLRAAHKRIELCRLEGGIKVVATASGPELAEPLNAYERQLREHSALD